MSSLMKKMIIVLFLATIAMSSMLGILAALMDGSSTSHAQEQQIERTPLQHEILKSQRQYKGSATNSRGAWMESAILVVAEELRLIREELEKMSGAKK